jgi:hypothetical protein
LLFVWFCVLFVCKCVLPPGDNPVAVNKYIISYQKQRYTCEMLPLETKQSGGKILLHLVLWVGGGVFLGEIFCSRSYCIL